MVTIERACGVLLAAVAVVLAALPLFGLLGYESSFVLAIAVSLVSAVIGAREPARARAAAPAAGPLALAFALWGRAMLRTLALLAAPLLVLGANALRVKNCALAEGLAWFALLPVLSSATGAAAGVGCGLVARTTPRAAVGAAALVAGSLAWGVARFYRAPAVFGYDPFAGYFPGSLYDEALPIEMTLIGARALHLAGVAAALLGYASFLDPTRVRLVGRPHLRLLPAALVALAAFAAAHRAARPVLAPTAGDVAQALGGRRETEHLIILHARFGAAARAMDFFARDAELRYGQLRQVLGGAPAGKITVYLFESPAEKRRWMGASQVQVAKPWRGEVYLSWDAPPHPVLAHELAHVFAARFGDPLFGVARRGLSFNLGLIEGVAVAAGDPGGSPGSLTLDQQVRAMRLGGFEPSLERVFGLGFLGEAPARAYTAAGSFVRGLLIEHGPEKLAAVYRAGGAPDAWRASYGRTFKQLVADWSRRIDAAPLDERQRAVVAERMRRPSILHRVCAHRLAEERAAAHRLSALGDHERALAHLEGVCRDDPGDPEPMLAAMDEAALAGDGAHAAHLARAVLAHAHSTGGMRARALIHLGDARLRAALRSPAPGPFVEAAEHYRAALALRLDDDTARQLRARELADDSAGGRALALYLVGDQPARTPALDLLRAARLIEAAPGTTPLRALGHYLLGRMLATHERFEDAVVELDRGIALGLPDGGFDPTARRLAAIAAFRAGDLRDAERRFAAIAQATTVTDPGAAREAADWLARCAFFREHR